MHEWAAVNGWTRPESKSEYGRYSVNIPIITPLPKSGFERYSKMSFAPMSPTSDTIKRCHTTMLGQATFMEKQQVYKPKEAFVESSTTQYIRYLEGMNKVKMNVCEPVSSTSSLPSSLTFPSFSLCLLSQVPIYHIHCINPNPPLTFLTPIFRIRCLVLFCLPLI